MKTPTGSFEEADTLGTPEGRSSGLERMVQREIADQVAGVLRNM